MGRRARIATGLITLAVSGVVAARRVAKPRQPPRQDRSGAPGFWTTRTPVPSRRYVGSAHVVSPRWEPRTLAALSRWEPRPPGNPLARAAAYLWAAPLTFAGLLAGLAAAVPPRLRDGVVLFAPARGPAGAALRARGFHAAAIGHVVISRVEPGASLLAHELAHVRQAERLGAFLAPLYLAFLVVYGYARHPLERAARRAGRRAARDQAD